MRKSFKIEQYLLFCSVTKRCEGGRPCLGSRKSANSVFLIIGTGFA